LELLKEDIKMDTIKVTRKTTESEMSVVLDFSPLKPNYREKINTTITFLNHMLEHIAWRGGFNLEVGVKLDEFTLTHVICEDLGIALGKAAREYIQRTDGAIGFGDAIGIIDEAKAECAISFEERAYIDIDYHGIELAEKVEGMDTEDLETFLEGFAQGAMCTLHIDLFKGHNGHHIWEAIYRAVGLALNRAFEVSEARKGKTAGVAGKINWVIE
jgi:imidazoleglycerol-phosphate dehydratase